jgi:hypothetical protein
MVGLRIRISTLLKHEKKFRTLHQIKRKASLAYSRPVKASAKVGSLDGPTQIEVAAGLETSTLARGVKFNSLHALVACRMLDGCRHRSLADANKY